MRRWFFNLVAAASLLSCIAAIVLWVRSYHNGGWDGRWVGRFLATSDRGRVTLFWIVPDGVKEIDFHYWKWAVLFAIAPFIWIIARRSSRRQIVQGLCVKCGYNLTGNVSGICPECGSKIAARIALPADGIGR